MLPRETPSLWRAGLKPLRTASWTFDAFVAFTQLLGVPMVSLQQVGVADLRSRLSRCRALVGVLLAMSGWSAACGGAPVKTDEVAPLGDPGMPYPASRAVQVGDLVHLPTGRFVTEAEMLSVVTDARVVFVGETHDNPASHRLELAVLRGMAERHPGKVALGMEMAVPSQQAVLDRWVAGELSERDFLEQSGWFDQWASDWSLYRDLLLFARDHHLPVVGLNAEDELVKLLVRTPLEELPEEVRARVPELDLNDVYQRAMVASVFGGHTHGRGQLDGFVRVQTLWDETMADNVARYLSTAGNEDMRMVVIAGGAHVRYGFGIPRRVFRRLPVSYVLVGNDEIVVPASKQEMQMEVEPVSIPLLPYDFLAYTAYEELPGKTASLGVLLEGDGEVRITGVIPESSAARAGLVQGDVIVSVAGVAVSRPFDVVYEVKTRYEGDTVPVVYRRGEAEQTVEVTFVALPTGKHGTAPSE